LDSDFLQLLEEYVDVKDKNPAAHAIVERIKQSADQTMLLAIAADRFGGIGARTQQEVTAGTREDMRLPRMLAFSGKGGPDHLESRNVTLLDHQSSVALMSAALAAVDILALGESEQTALECAAVCFATGMLHDVDKFGDRPGLTHAEMVSEHFDLYCTGDFLAGFSVQLTALQMSSLIAAVEARTAYSVHCEGLSRRFTNAVQRYVRFADNLDSRWLKGLPQYTAYEVVKAWNAAVSGSGVFVSKAFSAMKPLIVSDPHHPLIMDSFSRAIEQACMDHTGLFPLVHTVCDETIISILPADEFDAIVAEAADEASRMANMFDSNLVVDPKGIPKATGSRPDWRTLGTVVSDRLRLGSQDVRGLLKIRTSTIPKALDGFTELAATAGLPIADLAKTPPGKTASLIILSGENDPCMEACIKACLASAAIGIQEQTKSKAYTSSKRENLLAAALGDDAPTEQVLVEDALNRRSALAMAAAGRAARDPDFDEDVFGRTGLFSSWFGEQGVLADMQDMSAPVSAAIRARLLALAHGRLVEEEGGAYECYLTGEAVGSDPIKVTDELYGIKSSAVSNRAGTPENKFREEAAVRFSKVSYAELRLRTLQSGATAPSKLELPVRICAPSGAGLASLALNSMPSRVGLYDMVRADRSKRATVGAIQSYRERLVLGRYETPPATFADRRSGGKIIPGRISFAQMAMRAALRFGRPMHIFTGLPHPRLEFFYYDGLDPELCSLLGGNGFRLEELPDAVEKLGIVSTIAGPKGHGLGMPDAAKAFCSSSTRLQAACLAWQTALALGDDDANMRITLGGTLEDIIGKEIERMKKEGKTAPALTLGKMAIAIQRQPRPVDGVNDRTILFRKSLEAVELAIVRGVTDRDSLVATVIGEVIDFGDRRSTGSKGFYASKRRRPEGQTPKQALELFAASFVDDYWIGYLGGRPPSSRYRQMDLAVFRYAFTHPPVVVSDDQEDSESIETAEQAPLVEAA
jgi:hypothetical protein